MTPAPPSPELMRNHWWWRPGWGLGRRMYTWHMTGFNQQLLDLVAAYQQRLTGIEGLDPIPPQWLHMTTQGLGFIDEVPDTDVDAVIKAAQARLADLRPVTVEMGPAVVAPEVVRLVVSPAEPLHEIRRALRHAIVEVRGSELLMETEEWTPHVSVSYSSSEKATAPIAEVLGNDLEPVRVEIDEVQLIVLGRDDFMYTWETRAAVPLGSG